MLTMRKFVLVYIFAFGVRTSLSQDDIEFKQYDATTEPYKAMAQPNPLEQFEPFSFEDFKTPPKSDATVAICHYPNLKCINKLDEPAPVCAYARNYGLVNFDNICQIHVQNCLVQPLKTGYVYGVSTSHDVIFYNGKEQDCQYYIKQAKNLEDAIRLYYKAGYETSELNNNLDDLDQLF